MLIMIFLPYAFPFTTAAALTGLMCLPLTFSLFYQNRSETKKRHIIKPMILYTLVSSIAIYLSTSINLSMLRGIFGVVLILLSLYYIVGLGDITINPSGLSAWFCLVLTGLFGGLFSMAGPTSALYFLNCTSSKRAYLGTINLYFLCAEVSNFVVRAANGILTFSMIPYVLFGAVFVTIGIYFGQKYACKIDDAHMRSIIYGVIAIAGVISLSTALGLL